MSNRLNHIHPHGDRTRNSALRGRRLNQFDQRAITTLTSILVFLYSSTTYAKILLKKTNTR